MKLLTLFFLAVLSANAIAITKCVGKDGKIEFTDGSCTNYKDVKSASSVDVRENTLGDGGASLRKQQAKELAEAQTAEDLKARKREKYDKALDRAVKVKQLTQPTSHEYNCTSSSLGVRCTGQ